MRVTPVSRCATAHSSDDESPATRSPRHAPQANVRRLIYSVLPNVATDADPDFTLEIRVRAHASTPTRRQPSAIAPLTAGRLTLSSCPSRHLDRLCAFATDVPTAIPATPPSRKHPRPPPPGQLPALREHSLLDMSRWLATATSLAGRARIRDRPPRIYSLEERSGAVWLGMQCRPASDVSRAPEALLPQMHKAGIYGRASDG